ncbi:MAG: hypothetical protein K2H94_00705 [Duncaniella sp.]|nr:hypothetical protein [Duncaniella sp.]
MKRLKAITALLFCIYGICFAQKIEKNEIDRFTKNTIIETSSVKLLNVFGFFRPHVFNCCLRKVNDLYVLPTYIMFDNESVKITEDDGVYFLLDNDESVFLPTGYTGITDRRNSFDTVYEISLENAEILKNHPITAIRITYMGGYYEHDVAPKNKSKLIKMFSLIEEAEKRNK